MFAQLQCNYFVATSAVAATAALKYPEGGNKRKQQHNPTPPPFFLAFKVPSFLLLRAEILVSFGTLSVCIHESSGLHVDFEYRMQDSGGKKENHFQFVLTSSSGFLPQTQFNIHSNTIQILLLHT